MMQNGKCNRGCYHADETPWEPVSLICEHDGKKRSAGDDCPYRYVKEEYATIKILHTMNKEDTTTTTRDLPIPPDNVKHHERLCKELNDLYRRKNHDYGDSFHESWIEWGLPMAAIRIGDKYKRLVSLSKGAEQAVKDESIRDTLIDLANYSLMTVMELDRQKDAESPKWTKEQNDE